MTLFSVDRLYEEMAFLVYYTHWSREEIMNLTHAERARWCREISEINSRLNGEDEQKNVFDV